MGAILRVVASLGQAISVVSDHVSGADIVRETQRSEEQRRQRMSARVQSLREGFTSIRTRHQELAEHMHRMRRRRA